MISYIAVTLLIIQTSTVLNKSVSYYDLPQNCLAHAGIKCTRLLVTNLVEKLL